MAYVFFLVFPALLIILVFFFQYVFQWVLCVFACFCGALNKSHYTGYTQKNGAVSKVNRKFISHLTRARRTPSAAATVQVSHALPAVRFSCLLRGQFPRWRRSRKRLSVCSVFRCPDLWLQYTLCVFSKPCTKHTLHCKHRSGNLKTEHTESLFLLRRHFGNYPHGPVVSMRSELLVAHEKLGQLPLLTVYVVPV